MFLVQLVGNPRLAPLRVRSPHFHHVLLHDRFFAIDFVRHPAAKLFQSGIALLIETRLPMIKGPYPNMGDPTRLGNLAGRFPRLEEKLALFSCCKSIVNSFCTHALSIPDFQTIFNMLLINTIFWESPR